MAHKDKRIQVYLDDKINEKWETFLKNNSATFKNPTSLFRYMITNIELLAEKNNNLISKDEVKIKDLERQIENLKLQNFQLQSELLKKGSKDIVSLLEEINYKIDILEVINSTSLKSFPDIELVSSKDSTIYKKAKIKVDLKNNKGDYPKVEKEDTSQEVKKDISKHSTLFESNISNKKNIGGYFSRGI